MSVEKPEQASTPVEQLLEPDQPESPEASMDSPLPSPRIKFAQLPVVDRREPGFKTGRTVYANPLYPTYPKDEEEEEPVHRVLPKEKAPLSRSSSCSSSSSDYSSSPSLKRSNSLSNSLSAVKKHGRKLSLSSLSSALMGRRASTGAVPMSDLEEETPLRSDTFDQVVGSGNRSGMKLDRRKSVA